MKEQDTNFLKVLYNTLSLVSTKGEDTILMGECLKQLRDFIDNPVCQTRFCFLSG